MATVPAPLAMCCQHMGADGHA
jgi:hypothetical protein